MARCWKPRATFVLESQGKESREYHEAVRDGSVCLLPLGHDGPHKWITGLEAAFLVRHG